MVIWLIQIRKLTVNQKNAKWRAPVFPAKMVVLGGPDGAPKRLPSLCVAGALIVFD